jgi:hypothetical protein
MQSIGVTGERFGFRFDLEVSDFSLGIVSSGKSFVRFITGVRVRFRSLGRRGTWLRMRFRMLFRLPFNHWLAGFPLGDRLARQRLKSSRG